MYWLYLKGRGCGYDHFRNLCSVHMTEQGMQQISHSPPPGHGHSTQLVFGPVGLMIELVELVADVGSIVVIGRV